MATFLVNIFVGNTTMVDPDCYKLWLDGFQCYEAADKRYQQFKGGSDNFPIDVIRNDTMDNYRQFAAIEKHLRNPPSLNYQPLFQTSPQVLHMLIEEYYELDPHVARYVLGKKLSSRNRKDLDEISDATGVKLKSCRRQYDNFKRVFKTVEDMEGPMVKNIQNNFLISEKLARKYAAIVFFANNRFDTNKRRLQYLSFNDFCYCADQMIAEWTSGSKDPKKDVDADFDREFLQMLRELKFLSNDKESSDQHRNMVCNSLKGKIRERVYSDLESNFKNISKAIVNIASGMIHSKELKDFFNDVVEKIIEPCRASYWTKEEMRRFLSAYMSTGIYIDELARNTRLHKVFERYMKTLKSCIDRMYPV